MMQITGSFNVFGYHTRTIDLTPALGVTLIALVVFLIGRTSMGV